MNFSDIGNAHYVLMTLGFARYRQYISEIRVTSLIYCYVQFWFFLGLHVIFPATLLAADGQNLARLGFALWGTP